MEFWAGGSIKPAQNAIKQPKTTPRMQSTRPEFHFRLENQSLGLTPLRFLGFKPRVRLFLKWNVHSGRVDHINPPRMLSIIPRMPYTLPEFHFPLEKQLLYLTPPTNFRVYASLPRHCQSSICLIRSETSRLNECKGEHSSQGFVYYTIEFWEGARWSGRICIRPKHIKHHSGRECVAFWSLFSVALVFFFAPAFLGFILPWFIIVKPPIV